jgi:hypothetical protein
MQQAVKQQAVRASVAKASFKALSHDLMDHDAEGAKRTRAEAAQPLKSTAGRNLSHRGRETRGRRSLKNSDLSFVGAPC